MYLIEVMSGLQSRTLGLEQLVTHTNKTMTVLCTRELETMGAHRSGDASWH